MATFIIAGLVLFVLVFLGYFLKNKLAMNDIDEKIDYNPDAAYTEAQNDYSEQSISAEQYRQILIKLVEQHTYKKALNDLMKISSKEEQKKWEEFAAKAGDFSSITSFYGIKERSVKSKKYDEIIEALNKVKPDSQKEKDALSFTKGLVYFQAGKIKDAIPQLIQFSEDESQESKSDRRHLLWECCSSEKSIKYDEIIEILRKINPGFQEQKDWITYFKGLVYFNAGKYEEAIMQLEQFSDKESSKIKNDRKRIILKCYLKEKNMSKAEEIYSELEAEKCSISADVYLELSKLSKGEAAINFAKKYIDCPGVNKKSADYSDMLYFLGSDCWSSSSVYKCIKANDYFLEASNNGNEKAKSILDQYGVDGVLIDPPNLTDRTYHFMFDYEITAPQKLFKFLYTGAAFEYKSTKLAASFSDAYKQSFKSLQDIIGGVEKLYANRIGAMIAWGLKMLMHYGIDTYSADDILNRCGDSVCYLHVPEFKRQLAAIDKRAEELHIQMSNAKASRGHWTRTGYGTSIGSAIGASVKASIAAGAMNAGSSILHSIGDSIAGAINNSEINRMENNLFKSPQTIAEFETAFKNACTALYNVFFDILAERNVMDFEPLTGTIIYNSENISALDDKTLETKIQNHMSAKNFDYTYPMLIEILRRNSYEVDKYKSAVVLTVALTPEDESAKNTILPLLNFAQDLSLPLKNFDAELESIFKKYSVTDTQKTEIGSGETSSPYNISLAKKIVDWVRM